MMLSFQEVIIDVTVEEMLTGQAGWGGGDGKERDGF